MNQVKIIGVNKNPMGKNLLNPILIITLNKVNPIVQDTHQIRNHNFF